MSSEPRNETLVTYVKYKKAGMVRDDCKVKSVDHV